MAAVDLSVSDGKTHLRVLTNSEIKTFRRCPREHHYAYRLGYRPVERSQPLRFGTLWHAMQDNWWATHDLEASLGVVDAECDPFDHAHARALLRGYHARWIDESIETVGIELQFRAPMVNPSTGRTSRKFVMGGKIDKLVKWNGRMWLGEHKTTSKSIELGGQYWVAISLDPQVSTYVDGVRSLGHEVDGVLYDVTRKLGLRPLEVNSRRSVPETPEAFEQRCLDAIAEDPAKHYARGTIVRLLQEEDEARDDRWQVGQAITLADNSGHHARNVDACERFGSLCPYWNVCTGTASIEDTTKFRRIEEMHEELATP